MATVAIIVTLQALHIDLYCTGMPLLHNEFTTHRMSVAKDIVNITGRNVMHMNFFSSVTEGLIL